MTTLNINTLILTLSKIKNFGRKKIFKSMSLIENLNTLSLNEAYKTLEIDTKISETEFLFNYKIRNRKMNFTGHYDIEPIYDFKLFGSSDAKNFLRGAEVYVDLTP